MKIKLEVRDVNSALMQTSFACLFAARAETLKIACLTLGKTITSIVEKDYAFNLYTTEYNHPGEVSLFNGNTLF